MKQYDFKSLSERLLKDVRYYLPSWLPGGKLNGNEYRCASLRGGVGQSLSVNISTGKWADFASGNQKGGDLISLYAAIRGMKQIEAAKILAQDANIPFERGDDIVEPDPTPKPPAVTLIAPPPGLPPPGMEHYLNGKPVKHWTYTDANGDPLFYVARYNKPDGSKEFCPWSWDGTKWVQKIWPENRPMYNLAEVASDPESPVLLCHSDETEILTMSGWKKFKECNADDFVAQYHRDSELIDFVKPKRWQKINFSGKLVSVKNRWASFCVTDYHRMLVRKQKMGSTQICSAENLTYLHKLPVAGDSRFGTSGPTEDESRFLVALQADGCFPKRQRGKIVFNFKKKRKIDRLILILEKLNIPFEKKNYKSCQDWTHIIIDKKNISFVDKYLPAKAYHFGMLQWSPASRIAVLDELRFWDGDHSSINSYRYFTHEKINADVIHALAVLHGFGCVIREDRRRGSVNYITNLKLAKWRGFEKRNSGIVERIPYNGYVYCCTVDSGFIVTRLNGKTLISGNCEGEKASDASREIAGNVYTCVSWSGGVNGISKTDWSPIGGRQVLIWPDADAKTDKTTGALLPIMEQPGMRAAYSLAKILHDQGSQVKIINVGTDLPDGFDAYDALEDGWTWETFKLWAKERILVYPNTPVQEPVLQPEVVNPKPEPSIDAETDSDAPQNVAINVLWRDLGLAVTSNGLIICNADNVNRILERSPEFNGAIWYDEFMQRTYTNWRGPTREWTDNDSSRMVLYLQSELGLTRIPDNQIEHAVRVYSKRNTRNAPRDWMETLIWDGTPRIGRFFTTYMGAPESDYSNAVSHNFWVSMIARIYQPGCQVDNMVVLEGAQGIGKTRSLRAIGGDWYTEANESVESKDFFMVLSGNILVEIAELDSFSKAETTRIKQVVSCKVDRYRSPYGRYAESHPRQSIFVGTTNESHYLKDHTGGRRFWPIECGDMRYDDITRDRTQLFAEAVARFKQGSTWWETPVQATLDEQAARQWHDELEDVVAAYVSNQPQVHLRDVAEHLGFDKTRLDRMLQLRLSRILKQLGWKNVSIRSGIDHHVTRAWVRKNGACYFGS